MNTHIIEWKYGRIQVEHWHVGYDIRIDFRRHSGSNFTLTLVNDDILALYRALTGQSMRLPNQPSRTKRGYATIDVANNGDCLITLRDYETPAYSSSIELAAVQVSAFRTAVRANPIFQDNVTSTRYYRTIVELEFARDQLYELAARNKNGRLDNKQDAQYRGLSKAIAELYSISPEEYERLNPPAVP